MRKLDLQLFTGSSVTVYKDGGFSAGSASPNSSVAKDAEVTLSWTLSSGYELAEIEAVSGGPIEVDMDTKKFEMPDNDVVLLLKSKKNNVYKVTETCVVIINNSKTVLTKNTEVVLTPAGGIEDVKCTGTEITVNDAVQSLIDQGILVKM